MITPKIKDLFQFIDFLHSNIEIFKNYIPVVEHVLSINKEMSALKPDDNFEDRIKHKQLNEFQNSELDKVYKNVTKSIIGKAIELDICSSNQRNQFNWGFSEIRELKEKATAKDLTLINSKKEKYLEFKKNVNSDFLSLESFLSRLQEYLKDLFVFFDNNSKSEFEAFDKKSIVLNNTKENEVYLDKTNNPKPSITLKEPQPSNPNKSELQITDKEKKEIAIDVLQPIWLPEARISIKQLVELGIENKIWDKHCNLITKRNSLYSTGKTLLGSLSVALKKYAISEQTDSKIIGEAFCKKFNITIDRSIENPFKAFGTGNPKIIKQFERLLRLNS